MSDVTELTNEDFRKLWSAIAVSYDAFFHKLKNSSNIITPEIEKDYIQFQELLRQTIDETEDPASIKIDDIYIKIPKNRWVPILIQRAYKEKDQRRNEAQEDTGTVKELVQALHNVKTN